MIHIVLYEPQMPANTGNIGRTCLLTGSRLHLIRPFPFRMDDKTLRRTGLDYWKDVDLVVHDSFDEFMDYLGDRRIWALSTKGAQLYHRVEYRDGDHLMFGRESSGLPDYVLERLRNHCIRVPMIESSTRSLNLANTVSIVTYEAKRQLGFGGMR